jgi:hypothetical protein
VKVGRDELPEGWSRRTTLKVGLYGPWISDRRL